MTTEPQKKIIEINHALSGIYGEQLRQTAHKLLQARKQVLKRLERKRRLASVIYDELYQYLDENPQERLGLQTEPSKKKKSRFTDYQEPIIYKTPAIIQADGFFLGEMGWR